MEQYTYLEASNLNNLAEQLNELQNKLDHEAGENYTNRKKISVDYIQKENDNFTCIISITELQE